jgi:hypothetical protein
VDQPRQRVKLLHAENLLRILVEHGYAGF